MGRFGPVFLAFLLNSFGVTVFKDITNVPCGPLVSCLIFLASEFLLLLDLPLYPCELRKLGKIPHFIIEFLTSLFIMEYILVDFWNPLENYLITTTPKVGESFHDFLQKSGVGCKIIFCDIADFLRCDVAAIMSSYTMSLFFLTSVLHATRVVDFRLLSSGCKIFGKDILIRLKKFKLKVQQYFTGTKKRIKFKNSFEEEYSCPEDVCHLDEHHKAACPSFSEEFLPTRKPKDIPTKSSKKRKNHHARRENTPHCSRYNPLRINSDSDLEFSDTDTEFTDCLNNSHTYNRHVGRF